MTDARELASIFESLWVELIDGPSDPAGPFMLNSGDIGLLRSLDAVSADHASRTSNEGATIAAHAQHVRLGLSLMNRWASEGLNPFADPTWDDAWKIGAVDSAEWEEIKTGLNEQANRWLGVLKSPGDVATVELTGMIASSAHVACHLGAIRQIAKETRGPKEARFDWHRSRHPWNRVLREIDCQRHTRTTACIESSIKPCSFSRLPASSRKR